MTRSDRGAARDAYGESAGARPRRRAGADHRRSRVPGRIADSAVRTSNLFQRPFVRLFLRLRPTFEDSNQPHTANNLKKQNSQTAKPAGQNITQPELQERIGKRAYEIWETCGCPHGCEQQHWLQAESEVVEILGKQPGLAFAVM